MAIRKIKLKRGLEADLPTLDIGEPAFTTDSKKFFVGSISGNIEYPNLEAVQALISNIDLDSLDNLDTLATIEYVDNSIGAISIPSIEGLASESYVTTAIGGISTVGTADVNFKVETGKISLSNKESVTSEFLLDNGDWDAAVWTDEGGSGLITIDLPDTVYLTSLLIRYDEYLNGIDSSEITAMSNVTFSINSGTQITVNGIIFQSDAITIQTAEVPTSSPTNVTDMTFQYDYNTGLVLNHNNREYAIVLDDSNFEINTRRDINLRAGDDVRISARSRFDIINFDGGIDVITNNIMSENVWEFTSDGNFNLPGDINLSGSGADIYDNNGNSIFVKQSALTDYATQTFVTNAVNSISIPDISGLIRIVGVPLSSSGASGDKAGDIASDGTHLYICIADYDTPVYSTTFSSSYTGPFPSIVKGSVPQPQAGWFFTYNGSNYTLTGNATDAGSNWILPIGPASISTVSGASLTIGPAPTENIWKRVALSSDTW